jgi:NAD(P)-dependent dehydrogenase (short-subunit alcohol dehydrogenase family)
MDARGDDRPPGEEKIMGELVLAGQSALVTGGGSGIGLACAGRLLADGASVTIIGRTASKLEEAARGLEAAAPAGTSVQWQACDVTDDAGVAAAVDLACRLTGKLDIAVANAGAGAGGSIFATPLEMWRFTMEVNLTGSFLTIKHAGQAMAHRGGGSIVAISSIAGILTHRFMAPYCTAKAGLEMLVRCAADELGQAGIRVNAVRPGLVPTDLAMPLTDEKGIVDDYLDQMPVQRLGTVEDIAAGVRYLAGPESSWVTGQCFAIDGGHTLRRGPRVEPLIERFFGPEGLSGLGTKPR